MAKSAQKTKSELEVEQMADIQNKADELSIKEGCKVHPLVFLTEAGEKVIGFLKEPPRFVKVRVLDKALTGAMSAAAEIVDAYLLKEHSDLRIWEEKQENDSFYLGAVRCADELIKISIDQFKKK